MIAGNGFGHRRTFGTALLLATSSVLASGTVGAQAQAQSHRSFTIAAQPLATAIMLFGRQSGIQVTVAGDLVAGHVSSAVNGDLSATEALSQLLAGTGLTFRFVRPDLVTLEPAPQTSGGAVALGPVRVEGASDTAMERTSATYANRALATEGTKSYTTPVVSIGKGEQIRDIPQSVSVVTRQQIEDQGMTEITQAIAQAAGVSTNTEARGGELDFYTRGFEVNSLQIDGSSTGGGYSGYYVNPNLAMYDHVEVLRGVDGLFSGMGNPGGTINLVRKRPLRDTQLVLTASGGSWNNYRAEADLTGPIVKGGAVRARLVGSYIDRDFFYDVAMDRKKFVYGIVEIDVTPSTTVTIGGDYEDRHRKANYTGIPIEEDGTIVRLPRSTSLSPAWNGGNFKTWELFAGLEQRFGRDWVLKANVSRMRRKGLEHLGGWDGTVEADGTATDQSIYAWGYGYDSTRSFYDINLAGTFDLFGRTHKLLIGTDYQKNDWGQYYDAPVWADGAAPTADLYAFDPDAIPAPVSYRPAYDYLPTVDQQRGVYGRLTIEALKSVKLVLGGRVSWLDYDTRYSAYNDDGSYAWGGHEAYKDKGVFTPYGGIVVDILPKWTTYLSLARIYKSQASSYSGPPPGKPLAPLKGSSYELGVKGELANGRLNVSAAIYRSARTGEAIQDPAYPPSDFGIGLSCCYLNSGKIVSKGIDTEIAGELAPGWQISASYTYNHNVNHGDDNLPYNSIVPDHLAKLWTSYELSGSLSHWKIGGGVTAQSRIYVDETTWAGNRRRIVQPGYSLWNAMVEYKLREGLTVTLNVHNIFDKVYFASIGSRNYGAWYGEPRSFLVTLRGKF